MKLAGATTEKFGCKSISDNTHTQEDGWTVDADGYTTSFRVHAKNGKSVDDLHAVTKMAPQGLSCSWNLGAADFYPSTSGKVEAAK